MTKIFKVVFLLILVLVLGFLIYCFWPQISLLGDKEFVDNLLRSAGPWGAVIFTLLQTLQVVVAPIPSSVVSLAGGYVFGTFMGTLYSMIGSTFGFLIVFWLAKKFGRRLLGFFVSKKNIEKYDVVLKERAKPFIFMGFLLPIIPEAALGYVAGLTPLSIKTLMIITFISRIPGVVFVNFVGSQTASSNYYSIIGITVIIGLILAIMYKFKTQIEDFIDKVFPDDGLEASIEADEKLLDSKNQKD